MEFTTRRLTYIAALQDTNLTDFPAIEGWNIVSQTRTIGRKDSAGRGGVAIMIREGITYDVLKTCPNYFEYVRVRVFY